MELALHSAASCVSLSSSSYSNSLTPLVLFLHTRRRRRSGNTSSTARTFPDLICRRRQPLLQPLQAAAAASAQSQPQSPTPATARWLLQPVGDGNWKHIGSKVEMPDAFQIVDNEVTVGRLPDKADIVIPVATVSALHARIKNQQDRLLIIDLDSTNGTFIDDKRLNPGVVAAVSSGNCITFGDIHLAMFQVSKLKTVEAEAASKIQESEESIF